METLAFAFLLLLSVWALERKWLVWVLIALTLARPEGILVSLILLAWQYRKSQYAIIGVYLTFLVLMFGLRYWFYGTLLPNTATAKTGFSAEYLVAGLEYTWGFLRDGLLYGVVLIPIVWLFIIPKVSRD